MSATKPAENRNETRFSTDITIKAKNISEVDWNPGKIINLSRCGACIQGKFLWKRGTLLEIVTILKSSKIRHHSILASVAWTKGEQTGIKFLFEP